MHEIITSFFSGDLKNFIQAIGMIGVFIVIFSESGLLIGFFLPGDSLLFTAGLLSSPAFNLFNVWHLVLGAWVCAILGDNVGYEFGKRVGRSLFKKEKSFLFNPANLIKAQEFYEKHGGKAITIARFMPVIRTFAPIVAGIGHMNHLKFTFYNFLGGTIWVWSMVFGGYFLGQTIPNIDKYILPIVLLIIAVSIAPPLLHIYKENKRTIWEKIGEKLKNFFKYGVK
ncbi:MAG TPA: VTT domain-containing protein [bacterium]|nr:VTT domain-containing protein [bacterium]